MGAYFWMKNETNFDDLNLALVAVFMILGEVIPISVFCYCLLRQVILFRDKRKGNESIIQNSMETSGSKRTDKQDR